MIQPANPTLQCRCAEPITADSILTTRIKQANNVEKKGKALGSGREAQPFCVPESHQNCCALHRATQS